MECVQPWACAGLGSLAAQPKRYLSYKAGDNMRKKIISTTAILIFIISLLFNNAQALELHKEIHPYWYMLTCAGFGYILKLNNGNNTFRLEYGDECPTAIKSFFKGTFEFVNEKLELDFGDFKATYYTKMPYRPECDNIEDRLTKSEFKAVCHEEYLDTMKNFSTKITEPKITFLKKPGLFLEKINVIKKNDISEQLIKDLSTHVFSIYEK